MKSPGAYYLILIYVTVVIKPLIPFMQDAWSHQFNEIEHISIVHAKYGNNHLEKELAGAASGNDNKNQNPSLRSEDQVPFHILSQAFKYDMNAAVILQQYYHFKLHSLPLVCIPALAPPPRLS